MVSQPPLATVALDDPATRRAVDAYRRDARQAGVIGAVVVFSGLAIAQAFDGEPPQPLSGVAVAAIGAGVVPLVMGCIGLSRARRVRRLLSQRPWSDRAARYRIVPMGANGHPALVVRGDDAVADEVFSVAATVSRYRRLHTEPTGLIGFVRGGRRWAVVAPPDRSVVIMAKHPMLPWWRRRVHRWALEFP